MTGAAAIPLPEGCGEAAAGPRTLAPPRPEPKPETWPLPELVPEPSSAVEPWPLPGPEIRPDAEPESGRLPESSPEQEAASAPSPPLHPGTSSATGGPADAPESPGVRFGCAVGLAGSARRGGGLDGGEAGRETTTETACEGESAVDAHAESTVESMPGAVADSPGVSQREGASLRSLRGEGGARRRRSAASATVRSAAAVAAEAGSMPFALEGSASTEHTEQALEARCVRGGTVTPRPASPKMCSGATPRGISRSAAEGAGEAGCNGDCATDASAEPKDPPKSLCLAPSGGGANVPAVSPAASMAALTAAAEREGVSACELLAITTQRGPALRRAPTSGEGAGADGGSGGVPGVEASVATPSTRARADGQPLKREALLAAISSMPAP
mmetsp:Transcript_40913/g.100958  ORF Transcript_40913/g.100958 Transcript_40913/m.100958 type:complete len:388 (-) Transcript_40913:274-1437(-)